MFIKYGGSASDETSISSLIRFDVIISRTIDSVAYTLSLNINGEDVVYI